MSVLTIQQIGFSSILFDTLFGLVLFYSMDSFLDIKDPLHFIFYIFSVVILVHWWLIYKSADDAFGEEVANSDLDLIIGIIQVILIEYISLTSRNFSYQTTTWFLIVLLASDLIWVLIWRYIGQWHVKNSDKITDMENELRNDLLAITPTFLSFLSLAILSSFLSPGLHVFLFITFYFLFILLTFKFKIIDINFF